MGYRCLLVCLGLLLVGGCSPFANVPPVPPPSYTYAEDALRRGDYQEAVIRYDTFLGRSDGPAYRARALYQVAWAHYELHQYRLTLDMLNQLTVEYPNEPGPQIAALRGNAEYALGNQTNGFLAWEQAWQRANDTDRQALLGRMEGALASMSEPELRQLAALTTDPDVTAMVQGYLDQSATAAKTIPVRTPKPAARPEPAPKPAVSPEPETLPSGELYTSSPPPAVPADAQAPPAPDAEIVVDEREVIERPGQAGTPTTETDIDEQITVSSGSVPLPPMNQPMSTRQPPSVAPRVAALLPLTGTDKEAGWDALNALRLAFLDTPNALTVRDTAGQSQLARTLLTQLASDSSVVAVIGPLAPTDADVIGKDAERLKMPLVLLTQSSGVRGRFIVRVVTVETKDASTTMAQRFQQYTGRGPTKTESQVFLVGLAVHDALTKGDVTRDSVVADLARGPGGPTATDIAAGPSARRAQ